MKDNFVKSADKVLRLTERGSTVYAGLSGGADSVCLLLLLKELCPQYGLSLEAIHIDHCLRGAESDRDREFCTELCRRENIPLTVFRVDVRSYSAEKGLSTETAARELRYARFREAAGRSGYIATAHNLNDNAETVLLNMTRGTGLRGLCGIPPVRGNIIRPLLEISRAEIEDFLTERGQGYVTDSTNLTDDYSRNRIRHSVLPVLMSINSGLLGNIAAMTASLREDEYCLENIGGNDFAAVRKRRIAALFRENGITVNRDRLERTDRVLTSGGKAHICGDIYAFTENGILKTEEIIHDENAENFAVPLREGEIPFAGNRTVCVEKIKISGVHKYLTNDLIDCDKIIGGAVLRTRREGDRIMLPGEDFHRKLRKLYNSRKVPPHRRDTAAVIADSEGIIWAEYCGVSARAACTADTINCFGISSREG